jgi:hypothetical protein
VSAHVDDLLSCKCLTVMAEFKAHMLDRFIGTDEGEVTEYLGCELVRIEKLAQDCYFKPGMQSAYYASLTCGKAIQLDPNSLSVSPSSASSYSIPVMLT